MKQTLEHLSLLTRMEQAGLLLALTEHYRENALEQVCDRVESMHLESRLHGGEYLIIQRALVEDPAFAGLYQELCGQGINDIVIDSMVRSADGYGERLSQYPRELVLEAAAASLPASRKYEYLKYYLPSVENQEEMEAIRNNMNQLPIGEWQGLAALTANQREMLRLPYLGTYLDCYGDSLKTLKQLEQNQPLQKILALLYRHGVKLTLGDREAKDLQWVQPEDLQKFQRLLEVFEYDGEDLSAFFAHWLENHAGQYDLNWFVSQPQAIEKERRQGMLYSQLSYLNALYSGRLKLDWSAVRPYQFDVLIYAVEHKKTHFIKLVNEHSEEFLALWRHALLFQPGFCDHCNLNSLTEQNLRDCDSVGSRETYFSLLEEGQQYTFQELELLWQQDEIFTRLYRILTPLAVDQRLLTVRQLIKHALLSPKIGDTELTQLGECLLQKPFSEWYQALRRNIPDLPRRTAIQILEHYAQIRPFLQNFRAEADAIYALNNLSVLGEKKDWSQIRSEILTHDQDWELLREELGFSDQFVEQNRPQITEFLLRGGSAMVHTLYNMLVSNRHSVEALRRVVQAELMGRFYELKYFTDDLRREIRYPISPSQEALWRNNTSLAKGGFRADEEDDFFHTLRLGELPHPTCLSYRTGIQRECLLAAFDSNKKIILVRKGDTVVGRASLRLTKGAFQEPKRMNFSFADLGKEGEDNAAAVPQEKLVLFLEYMYVAWLNDEESKAAKELAVSLTTKKAADLGAIAVLAKDYYGCYAKNAYVSVPRFYVYLSKSKNGKQYLDSLGGEAVTSSEEQYVGALLLVEQTALQKEVLSQ